jgi:hypothetical protein
VDVNRAARFGFKPGVEKTVWVVQRSALEEVQLDVVFEDPTGNDASIVRPYRRIPLPFFRDVRRRRKDEFTQSGQHFAAPVGEFRDVLGDALRWVDVVF